LAFLVVASLLVMTIPAEPLTVAPGDQDHTAVMQEEEDDDHESFDLPQYCVGKATIIRKASPIRPSLHYQIIYPAQSNGSRVPAATQDGPYPTMVFFPGSPGFVAEWYDFWGEYYAARGILWVGVGLVTLTSTMPASATMHTWVLNDLMKENSNPLSPMYGLMDTSKIISSGHSNGAMVAIGGAAIESRYSGLVAYAGGNQDSIMSSNVNVPAMYHVGSADPRWKSMLDHYNASNGPKSYVIEYEVGHGGPFVHQYSVSFVKYWFNNDADHAPMVYGAEIQMDRLMGKANVTYDLKGGPCYPSALFKIGADEYSNDTGSYRFLGAVVVPDRRAIDLDFGDGDNVSLDPADQIYNFTHTYYKKGEMTITVTSGGEVLWTGNFTVNESAVAPGVDGGGLSSAGMGMVVAFLIAAVAVVFIIGKRKSTLRAQDAEVVDRSPISKDQTDDRSDDNPDGQTSAQPDDTTPGS